MDARDIGTLSELVGLTRSSAYSYSEAAREAGRSPLKALLLSRSSETRELVRQLREEIEDLGGQFSDEDPTGYRPLPDLRRALTKGEPALIDELERVEAHLQARYEAALKRGNELSQPARGVILRAYQSVRAGHDQVRNLKLSDASPHF